MTHPKRINLTYKPLSKLEKFDTREQVEARISDVSETVQGIKEQIAEAHSIKREQGVLIDGDWLSSAERALRENNIQLLELHRILGEFTRLEKSNVVASQCEDFNVDAYMRVHGRLSVEQNFPDDVHECEALLFQVLKDMASINEQIDRAKRQAKQSGIYASNQWYVSANKALKIKKATHQALLQHAGNLRKRVKQAEGATFARKFLDAARELLDKETYDRLFEAAQAAVATENNKKA